MTADANYSHDGLHDQLTHCAAPPFFYSHLARIIAGSTRTATPFTLVSISISPTSGLEEIVSIAHEIHLVMRQEDLCGRTGKFEFVIAVSGDFLSGKKLLERVSKSANIEFSSEIVEWIMGETSLQLLYRLDMQAESRTIKI